METSAFNYDRGTGTELPIFPQIHTSQNIRNNCFQILSDKERKIVDPEITGTN